MIYNIKAKVYKVGNIQNIPSQSGGEPYRKRTLILDASRFDPYTGEKGGDNPVVIEFSNKRVDELDKFRVGDLVDVQFVVQGRKYTDKATQEEKFFTSLVGLGVEMVRMNQREVQSAVQPVEPKDEMPF